MNTKIKNRFEYFLFSLFSKLLFIIGLEKSRLFAKGLSYFFYYLIPIRKKTVIQNLKYAFPHKSLKEINAIAFESYHNFALILCEILIMPHLNPNELSSLMYCDNLEVIQNAIQKDSGLIFLTAHYGNWEMGAAWMGQQLNAPMHVVAKPLRNALVSNWMINLREHFSNKVILLGASIKNLYYALKKKQVIGMLSDQRGPKEGLRVNFFEKETAVYSGAAVLSLKSGAPIVVAMINRQKDYKYKIHLEKLEISESVNLNFDDKVKLLTQRYFDILENNITQNPSYWFWMHKIWKY